MAVITGKDNHDSIIRPGISCADPTLPENIKITELLDYSRILYNKCLYKECVKMLDKAKAMAMENDRSVLLLEILELEKLVIP